MFVKVCPVCGCKNDPLSIECRECFNSIIDEPAVAEQSADEMPAESGNRVQPADSGKRTENSGPELVLNPDVTGASIKTYVRICPCGHENPAGSVYCENCGEELSYIVPTEKNAVHGAGQIVPGKPDISEMQNEKKFSGAERNMQGDLENSDTGFHHMQNAGNAATQINSNSSAGRKIVITSADGRYSETLEEQVTIIGRESGFGKYLSGCSFVSRKHAGIMLVDGKAVIKDYGSTNGTFVNGERVDQTFGRELAENDLVSLGGIEFRGTRDPRIGFLSIRLI